MNKRILIFFSGILFTACGPTQSFENKQIRPAVDVPVAFEPKDGMELAEDSCISPLVDARTGNEIILVSSQNGKGDYQVEEGLYGVGSKELLRIECRTGKVLGIVKK